MIQLYNESDFHNALNLKKRLLTIYLCCIGALFCATMVFFILYLRLPYPSTSEIESKKNLYLVINGIITAIGIIFSFIYIGIPYKRARYYYKLLEDIKLGQKVKNVSTFINNDESITDVGNVDFHTMVVLEWSDKTQEYMRRHVLVDKEKPLPNLNNGDIITYITHANVLLAYGYKSDDDVFEELTEEK